MSATSLANVISPPMLERFAQLIYDKTGIRFSHQKRTLLSVRLNHRLAATRIKTYEAYLDRLKRLEATDPEWNELFQEITTHETYLFRDLPQWDWFRNQYLTAVETDARNESRGKELRVWSAACSTGDEAYTIATCIADRLMHPTGWNIEILGTDIGIHTIRTANDGQFTDRAMHQVPTTLKKRFFLHSPETKRWRPRAPLTDWVRFQQHNLLFPLRGRHFDIVFLKNVLIYFDADSKLRALKNIANAIVPGGRLVIGPAEGIGMLDFGMQHDGRWLYTKI